MADQKPRSEIANPLKQGIANALKKEGFKVKRTTWSRQADGLIQVVNLQKSSFGNQYYINIGIYIQGIEGRVERQSPTEYQCDIRARVENLCSLDSDILAVMLDMDDGAMSFEARRELVGRIVVEYVIPLLDKYKIKQDVMVAINQNKLEGFHIFVDAVKESRKFFN